MQQVTRYVLLLLMGVPSIRSIGLEERTNSTRGRNSQSDGLLPVAHDGGVERGKPTSLRLSCRNPPASSCSPSSSPAAPASGPVHCTSPPAAVAVAGQAVDRKRKEYILVLLLLVLFLLLRLLLLTMFLLLLLLVWVIWCYRRPGSSVVIGHHCLPEFEFGRPVFS